MKKLLLPLLFILAGCSLFIAAPEVKVKDVSFVGLDGNGVDIDLFLTVTNPNSYAVNLLGYTYDLQVLAVPLARGESHTSIAFAGDATTEVRLPVKITYRDLLELLKRRPDPDRIPYRLNAGLDLGTPLGALAIPVNHSGTVTIPQEYRPLYFLKQASGQLNEGNK